MQITNVYVYVCVGVYIFTHARTYSRLEIRIYICVYVNTCKCNYLRVHKYAHIHKNIIYRKCIYNHKSTDANSKYVRLCMCHCVYTNTHTHICTPAHSRIYMRIRKYIWMNLYAYLLIYTYIQEHHILQSQSWIWQMQITNVCVYVCVHVCI